MSSLAQWCQARKTLADDFLDTASDPAAADKTLGTERHTGKLTAASVAPEDAPPIPEAIAALLQDAQIALAPWPEVEQACRTYIADHLSPLITRYLRCVSDARCRRLSARASQNW